MTIAPGEKLAIVGLNGAGKTTLVKLICGLLDPTSGCVLLNGIDIRRFNRQEYYTAFSTVFQDFSVLDISVAENVAQRIDGIDRERVNDCLALAGLTEKISELPNGIDTKIGHKIWDDGVELSGGQIQRLMLARALYRDAPMLLLDEPTAVRCLYHTDSHPLVFATGLSSSLMDIYPKKVHMPNCWKEAENTRISMRFKADIIRKGGSFDGF